MSERSTDRDKIMKRLDQLEERLKLNSATTHRLSDRLQRRMYAQFEALIGLYRDLDGLPSFPPLRNWAISPDTARELHSLINEYRPNHVVECGSGSSTILLGHLVAAGVIDRVTSIEHDAMWYEATRKRLRAASLLESVTLLYAPITEHATETGSVPWYSIDVGEIEPLDMLIVDGPPRASAAEARAPALPILESRMQPGCLIVIDDYARAEEQAMVNSWLVNHPVELLSRSETVEKWMAVLEYQSDRDSGKDPTS